MNSWEITEAGSILQIKDPEGWYRAAIKQNGDVYLVSYDETPEHLRLSDEGYNDDTIYIADLDAMIERLHNLKIIARQHFGTFWR